MTSTQTTEPTKPTKPTKPTEPIESTNSTAKLTLFSDLTKSTVRFACNLVKLYPLDETYFLHLQRVGTDIKSFLFNSILNLSVSLPSEFNDLAMMPITWHTKTIGQQTTLPISQSPKRYIYVNKNSLFLLTVSVTHTNTLQTELTKWKINEKPFSLQLTNTLRFDTKSDLNNGSLRTITMVCTRNPTIFVVRLIWRDSNTCEDLHHTIILNLHKMIQKTLSGSLARMELSDYENISGSQLVPQDSFTGPAQFFYLKRLPFIPVGDNAAPHFVATISGGSISVGPTTTLVDYDTMEEFSLNGKYALNYNSYNDSYYMVETTRSPNQLIHSIEALAFSMGATRESHLQYNFKMIRQKEFNIIRILAISADRLEEYEKVIQCDPALVDGDTLYAKIHDAIFQPSDELTSSYIKSNDQANLELVLTININTKYVKEALTYTLTRVSIDKTDLLERRMDKLQKEIQAKN
jgi:hypothetical protein